MKYYENLRLVYEMEARVRELRRSTEAEPAPRRPGETPKHAGARWHRQSQLDRPRGQQVPPCPKGSPTPPERGDAGAAGGDGAGRFRTAQEEENSRKRFSGLCGQQLKTKPGFPATQRWTWPRVRLSLRKAA